MNNQLKCPKCGTLHDDFDGLPLTHCTACGWCSHSATTRKHGREVCEVCGCEIRLEKLRENVYQTIEMKGQRVLSVKNPWAYLIMHYGKDVENRRQQTKYRGRILIHASKTSDLYAYERRWAGDEAMQKIFDSLVLNIYEVEKTNGHIIGSVDLHDCVKGSQSVWAENLPGPWSQFHWLLRDPHPFSVPLQARGMLGLWTYESLEEVI
jgi:hypothetical protein